MTDKEYIPLEELKKDFNYYCYFYNKIEKKIDDYNRDIESIKDGTYPTYMISSHSTTNLEYEEKKFLEDEKNRISRDKRSFSTWKNEIFSRKIVFTNQTVILVGTEDRTCRIPLSEVMLVSRHSPRYIEMSKVDIGGECYENYGEVKLVGDYKPNEKDIESTRYHHYREGKISFGSAKFELENKSAQKEKSSIRINIDTFFRLNFKLSEQGLQSRALYDDNNSIIDGSAGTGKSTISIQKLEYYYKNLKILQEKMLIIVKNNHLKKDFKSLLEDENLKLNDIEIKTVDELNSSIKNYNIDSLEQSKKESLDIKKIFNNFISARNAISISEHYKSLLNFFNNKNLLNKEEKFSLKNIEKWQYKYANSVYKDYFLALEYLYRYQNYYDNIYRTENKKLNIKNKIKKLEKKLNNEELTDEEYEIYDKLEIDLNKLESKKIERYTLNKEKNLILKKRLEKLYFNKNYIDNYLSMLSNTKSERDLVLKYLNLGEYEYDTIVIDEAQDYSLVELEAIRLYTKRIILTGDILQNLDNGEINDWNDILNVNEIYGIEDKNGEKKLNIFTLKHNFRQTYQLANASYNFRQLLLDRELVDIQSEYYLSEREFNGTPYQLPTIIFNQSLKKYIDAKIKHIKNTFTSQVPIVLVYKTNKEKENYEQKLANFRLSYDTGKIENIDVILVDILEAKGKQFPIVISNLDGLTNREIYLIMTRGQFEVEFLSSKREIDNEYLKVLTEKGWIETKDIKFISTVALEKPVNSKKDFNNINSLDQDMRGQLVRKENDENFEQKEYLNENNISLSKVVKDKTPKNKENLKSTDDNISSSESIKNDLLDAKRKHEGEIKEIEIELNPTVIQDVDTYIQEAQKEYEKNLKNVPTETTTYIVTRNVKVGTKETKWFLEKQYQGLCQICGFTFSKRNGKGQYFNLFNWFSEKISKQKVNLVQAGSSLSLCSRCHSGVKYGSFKADLTDILKDIDISKLNFDDFVSKISISVDKKEIPECYDFIEMDMYKVDINLFGKEQFIFYTEEHFLHLYTMLRLRK